MTDEGLGEKFMRLSSRTLGEKAARELGGVLHTMDERSAEELLRLM